jgi:hypothetical protein
MMKLAFTVIWPSENAGKVLKFKRCWTYGGSSELITVYIRWKNGFLPESQFVYRANSTSGDYQDEINCENFSRWLNTRSHSQLAIQQTSNYEECPISEESGEGTFEKITKKEHMVSWLEVNGYLADMSMRRIVLYLKAEVARKELPDWPDF